MRSSGQRAVGRLGRRSGALALGLWTAACGDESAVESNRAKVPVDDAASRTDAAPTVDASSSSPPVERPVPETFIETRPPARSGSSSALFRFTASLGFSTFECALDTVVFTRCSSETTFEGLSDGPHTLQVRAYSRDGVYDDTPAEHAWTVDTRPPNVEWGAQVPARVGPVDVVVVFDVDEPASFECTLDGGRTTACSSPHTLSGLSEGLHSLRVGAVDLTGNPDPTPASVELTVDLTPPETDALSAPARVGPGTLELALSSPADDLAGFECRVGNAPFAPCVSPWRHEALPEGEHLFEVRAVDTVGLTDPTPSPVTVEVDLTPPGTPVLVEGPDTPSAEPVFAFVFETEGAVTHTCRLDEGAAAPCASPHRIAAPGEGPHTLRVAGVDDVGNEGPSLEVPFELDTVPPGLEVQAGPLERTRDPGARFVVALEPGATLVCRVDAGPFEVCTPSEDGVLNLGDQADGAHVFSMRATDAAGNTRAVDWRWEVDTTPPVTLLVDTPPSRTASTGARIRMTTLGDEGDVAFECALDDAADLAPCASPLELDGLPDGEHVLRVQATDALGNREALPVEARWTVDTVPAETRITSAPARLTREGLAAFTFDAEPDARYECRFDGEPWADCVSPATRALDGDGDHAFEVRARDDVGNVDRTPARHVWAVDRSPPETGLEGGPPAASSSPDAAFTLLPQDALFVCTVDDAPTDCVSSWQLTGLPEGEHTVTVTAFDEAGNAGETLAFAWRVDLTPPTLQWLSTPSPRTLESLSTFTAGADERVTGFLWAGAPGLDAVVLDTATLADLPEGRYRIEVHATDEAGNPSNRLAHDFEVDRTPPNAPSAPVVWPGDRTALVQWSVESPEVRGFDLERAASVDGPWTLVAEGLVPTDGVGQWLDRGVANDTSVAYRLTATDDLGLRGAAGASTASTPTRRGVFEQVPNVTVRPWAAAMLPTGKLLLSQNNDVDAASALFDPETRTLAPVSRPLSNTFCAGLAHLDDGRVLVVGGHEGTVDIRGQVGWLGLNRAQTFDPVTETWTALPNMPGGYRWYPSALTLADGRVLVTGGIDSHSGEQIFNRNVDLYDPSTNTWRTVTQAPGDISSTYPRKRLLPDGSVHYYGPQTANWRLNPVDWTWTRLGNMAQWHNGGAAVDLESGHVLYFGGQEPPTTRAERYDPFTNRWSATPNMAYPRLWPNGVTLPGGLVLAVGGRDAQQNIRTSELYDPARNAWEIAGDNHYGHEYHSTALLQPDGSVFSGGPEPQIEIFEPWYLNAGPRPSLDAPPAELAYEVPFELTVRAPLAITDVVLVRLGTVTHAMDLDQRHVTLDFEAVDDAVYRVSPPSSRALARAGHYYLVALDERGVPSPGHIVRLR